MTPSSASLRKSERAGVDRLRSGMAIDPVSSGLGNSIATEAPGSAPAAQPPAIPASELPNAAQLELSALANGLFGTDSTSSGDDPVLDALLDMGGGSSAEQTESDQLLSLLDDNMPRSFAEQQAVSAYGQSMAQGNSAPA